VVHFLAYRETTNYISRGGFPRSSKISSGQQSAKRLLWVLSQVQCICEQIHICECLGFGTV